MQVQSQIATVEIWADNVSLQQFTKKQWRSYQDKSIPKMNKLTNMNNGHIVQRKYFFIKKNRNSNVSDQASEHV